MTGYATLPDVAGWAALDGQSSEICYIQKHDDKVCFDAAAAGDLGTGAFGVRYQLVLNDDWSVRRLDLESIDGRALRLRRDDDRWFDGDGALLPALEGCRWLDVRITPLTNSLPVRGTDWYAAGDVLHADFVYIDVPSLAVSRVAQTYTRLDAQCFRYVQGDFTADVRFDESGLVTDYPGLFRRFA